jgi:amino acid transporter
VLTIRQVLLVASTEGLIAGGVAGLFWSYIWTYAGMTLVVLSLAEMASMAPTSGGQYHWVSEFAPPEYQKLLSYFTGWMSAMSWQAGAASGPFLVGTIIQSLVYVNKESYEATNWQGTMMVGLTYIWGDSYRSLTVLGLGDHIHRVPWQRLRWKGYACVPERHAHCSRIRILRCKL